MYRGFNIKIEEESRRTWRTSNESYTKHKNILSNSLLRYLQDDGSLDGTTMREDWFPDIKCDVFISHSSIDKGIALELAGYLFKYFGLTSFIDSSLWEYSDELLKRIDDKYCYDITNDTYRYKDRNYSTSHIHMMLASALTLMIDKTECLFFINTPNSLTVDNIESKTLSPWIYHELLTSKYIRRRIPERFKPEMLLQEQVILKEAGIRKGLKITHTLDMSGFTELRTDDLQDWVNKCDSQGACALDYLYDKYPGKL